MSDGILSGLRDTGTFANQDYNRALDDVAGVLRNPTDEQVEAIVADYAVQVALRNPLGWPRVVRAVLAAAAGGRR